jgi:hypothetical protein
VAIPQICARTRGPGAATAHEAGCALVRVLIGCVFVRVVIESEICRIYEMILWIIKAATRNLSGTSNFIA